MKTLEIKKGWFWSAGNKYKWAGQGYDRPGIGIDCRTLINNPQIKVIVHDKVYLLESSEAIDFVRKFSAFETHQGIKLAVVSKSLFKDFPVEM